MDYIDYVDVREVMQGFQNHKDFNADVNRIMLDVLVSIPKTNTASMRVEWYRKGYQACKDEVLKDVRDIEKRLDELEEELIGG